jgi:hypothetical protein
MKQPDRITGEWDATLEFPNQPQSMTMMLMLEDKTVSGRFESPSGVHMFENGEFDKNQLRLYMPSEQGEIKLLAKLEDNNRLVGEYNIANRDYGTWEAVKR